ncbi:hypothetical protein FACS1894200_01400 [Spirochaetia bacterium]|nr:hypothetical protein FACS1894200_01400 [Spirochaetia bacterium]
MAVYPEALLPKPDYPRLANGDIADCALVRETMVDLYGILGKRGCTPDDVLRFIVAPQPSLREVFELSLFLYGYYEECHCGIRVDDTALYADWTGRQGELRAEDIQFTQGTAWPLFLAAQKLDRQTIDFNGEEHLLSFAHKPTRANYWHFELWMKDSDGERIPRNKSNAHTKYLAKSILEYIVAEVIVYKPDVQLFTWEGFSLPSTDR